MRSGLRNGKIIAPTSYAAAVARHRTLVVETGRIAEQISDRARRERFDSDLSYQEWQDSARAALTLYRCEQHQLAVWIDEQHGNLFRQAYELLKTLQKEETLFEDNEQALIEQLDAHFATITEQKETA